MIDSLKILIEQCKNIEFHLNLLYLSGKFPHLKDLTTLAKKDLIEYQLRVVHFSDFDNKVTQEDVQELRKLQSASNGIQVIIQTAFPSVYKIA